MPTRQDRFACGVRCDLPVGTCGGSPFGVPAIKYLLQRKVTLSVSKQVLGLASDVQVRRSSRVAVCQACEHPMYRIGDPCDRVDAIKEGSKASQFLSASQRQRTARSPLASGRNRNRAQTSDLRPGKAALYSQLVEQRRRVGECPAAGAFLHVEQAYAPAPGRDVQSGHAIRTAAANSVRLGSRDVREAVLGLAPQCSAALR